MCPARSELEQIYRVNTIVFNSFIPEEYVVLSLGKGMESLQAFALQFRVSMRSG